MNNLSNLYKLTIFNTLTVPYICIEITTYNPRQIMFKRVKRLL